MIVYAIGLFADVAGAFALVGFGLTFRERTLRGEVFAIRYVTPLTERIFRLER